MKNLEKAREQRLRRLAYKQGLRIRKSRIRKTNSDNYGKYLLIDAYRNVIKCECSYDMTLTDIEVYLNGG